MIKSSFQYFNKFSLLIVLNFFIFNVQAQTWTWMKGLNTTAPTGTYGTKGLPALTNTPPGLYEAGEWTDLNGNFWLIGGYASGFHSALWRYNPTTNMWTWMNGLNTTGTTGIYGVQGTPSAANYPTPRNVPVTWLDNTGNLWLFGGYGYGFNGVYGALSDLWKYDIATNQWTWINGPNIVNQAGSYGTIGVSAATNEPPSRGETSASWTDNAGDLWMFGGHSGTFLAYNDLWKYNIATNQWTWMKGANTTASAGNYGTLGLAATTNEPPARGPFAKWKDNAGNLWMFGGLINQTACDKYNDLWKYDVATNMWTWVNGPNTINDAGNQGSLCVANATNLPSSRYESRTAWTDSCGNFWLFGGSTGSGNTLCRNDLWYYNVTANEWKWISGSNAPAATGTYGTQGTPNINNIPPSRNGAIPFYTNNRELWLFGGFGNTGQAYNDLWKYVIDTNCVPWCFPVTQNPTANFTTSTQNGCASLTVNFTNSSNNSNAWTWTFGDGNNSTQQNPTNTYTNPGTYTVTLIATDGTTSDTTTQTINVYANAVASYTASNDTLCTNQSVTFTNTSTNTNGSNWNFGNGNTSTATSPTTTYPTAGNYTVTLIALNANGCPDTLTMPITVIPSFTQNQTANICTGQTYTLPSGIIVNTSGVYNDTLTTVNGCDSIINTTLTVTNILTSNQSPVLCQGNSFTLPSGTAVNTAGTYIDTVTSTGGCDSVITTTLTVNQHSASNQTNSICNGNSFALPDGTIVTAAGTYTDSVPNSKGCDSIITITLTVNPNPTVTLTATPDSITQGQSTTITASGGGTYSWTPTTGLNPTTGNTVIATPNQTTTYCVIVTDTNGCTDSACITIYVKEIPCPEENNLAVPNAFSPNNDGVNEEFCLQGWVPCIESFAVTIFDRWGEKVFESSDPNFCWDGTYQSLPAGRQGKSMDAQVFVYYIKATFINIDKAVVKKGNISLIR